MPQRTIYVYGPPGTGKTSKLIDLAARAIESYGPDRVGLITYTRAAAAEAKQRMSVRFGCDAAKFPYIGTIHAMGFKLLGLNTKQIVDGKGGRFKEFCQELQLPEQEIDATAESVEGFWWADADVKGEALVFREAYSAARHKRVSLEETTPLDYDPERFQYIAERYEAWKRRERLYDFEDMLERGAEKPLPVRVLLCDEQQDNSALMWEVEEKWAQPCVLAAYAADPYQALYQWIGGDPQHFLTRVESGAGQLIPLGDSHRLTAESAAYAKQLLFDGGWEDDTLLASWDGVGTGSSNEGTTFYLARTHRLLRNVERQLMDEGTPYADLKGYSKLTSAEGRGFRTLVLLQEQGLCATGDFQQAVKTFGSPAQMRAAQALSGEAVTYPVAVEALRELPEDLAGHARYADYLHRVYAYHGLRGLVNPPKTHVGTIHSAKGREADTVHLITSWAYLPARARRTTEGMRSESLVAYVAASRHRNALDLREGEEGLRYPFDD